MSELKIEYKYSVGQVIFFMYENEIRKGIVTRVKLYAESGELKTCLTEKIIQKIISILPVEYPFDKITQRYSIDLVSKRGGFGAGLGKYYDENELFKTQKDIIHWLSLK